MGQIASTPLRKGEKINGMDLQQEYSLAPSAPDHGMSEGFLLPFRRAPAVGYHTVEVQNDSAVHCNKKEESLPICFTKVQIRMQYQGVIRG